MKAKVTARGQVSIPSSRVEWIVDGNVIKVIPLPKDPVAAFKGRGSRKFSTERLIEERRAERKKRRK